MLPQGEARTGCGGGKFAAPSAPVRCIWGSLGAIRKGAMRGPAPKLLKLGKGLGEGMHLGAIRCDDLQWP
jgi:hypothetical protein